MLSYKKQSRPTTGVSRRRVSLVAAMGLVAMLWVLVPARTLAAPILPAHMAIRPAAATCACTPEPDPAPGRPPEPVPDVPGREADEAEMLKMVNGERARAGAPPLQMDPTLVRIARLKSQDMITLGYFDHQSPTYGSPFAMMKRYGVVYRKAGENLAGSPRVGQAHTSLMESPGHRRNLLNPEYTRVGIGIVAGGPYGLMVTQLFVG